MDKLGDSLDRLARLEKALKRGPRKRRKWKAVLAATLLAALCLIIAVPPFRYPVGGRVSSRFFPRKRPEAILPVTIEMHHGLDIATQHGTPVLASAMGVVAETGYNPETGNYVRVRHLLGFTTLYGHLSEISVQPGIVILLRSLRPIGRVGSTGRSTGPHVHFELALGGTRLPPTAFLVWHDLRRLIVGR